MADAERRLHRLVEEGTLAAHRPPVEQLRGRVSRRRAWRRSAGAALAAVILAVPVAWYTHSAARPGLATPGGAASTGSVAPITRSGFPSLTAAQQQALVEQQAGTLTIAPTSVAVGASVQVSGHGCAPGQAVELGFGSHAGTGPVVTVQASPSGSFEGAVAIPPATATGVQRLWAQCAAAAAGGPTAQYGAAYVFTP